MNETGSTVHPTPPLTVPNERSLVRWTAAAAMTLPVSVLLHELGHYLCALAFGFHGASLSYSAAPYTYAESIYHSIFAGDLAHAAQFYPLWQLAANAAAGPLAAYLALIACSLLAWRVPDPFVITLGFNINLRVLPLTLIGLFQPQAGRNDEDVVAILLGIPAAWLILAGLLLFVASSIWLLRSLPRGQRFPSLLFAAIGTVVGCIFYAFIGPLLLP